VYLAVVDQLLVAGAGSGSSARAVTVSGGWISKDLAGGEPESERALVQAHVPPMSDGFVTEAVAEEMLEAAILLYRRYFSDDCFYLLPLLVHGHCGFGLDFQDCRTTVVFPEQPQAGGPPRLDPAGAVTWRLRTPALPAAAEMAGRDLGLQVHGAAARTALCISHLHANHYYIYVDGTHIRQELFCIEYGFVRVARRWLLRTAAVS
jgi:hypothetical protein